ncbi:MAG TPA: RdgB/HAM1 family non-canonical purine NTP pyrophosphatase [Planctomycetota bacterium]|jgi:XTP/dITP diphosphohydrolase|nr:RdgB/HAM1 family non-canonical purine NTP pyrophosphatase [Planctomycetota bacterium]
MKTILLGSGNAKKLQELREMLAPIGLAVVSPSDLKEAPPPPEETEDSFLGNARLKACAYAQATGLPTLADDSGLCVDALQGRPGVFSARYAGPVASDKENNELLLRELKNVPDDQRTAHYTCSLVLATPERVLLETEGHCHGSILREPRGEGGFGYDPLFLLASGTQTFAELGAAEKALVSHRGLALRALIEKLTPLLHRLTS